jgi:hypothetical protein
MSHERATAASNCEAVHTDVRSLFGMVRSSDDGPEQRRGPPSRQRTERAMKITAILSALLLTVAIAGMACRGQAAASANGTATATGQKIAYGADTVCKLGCWS